MVVEGSCSAITVRAFGLRGPPPDCRRTWYQATVFKHRVTTEQGDGMGGGGACIGCSHLRDRVHEQ